MSAQIFRKAVGCLCVWVTIAAGAMAGEPSKAQTPPGPRLFLEDNWRIRSSHGLRAEGDAISTEDFTLEGWHATTVPTTVLSALIKRGVYPDVRLGLNSFRIPDSSDEFNRKHGLAKYSHLPEGRNPWRDPYWFRTEFDLPGVSAGRRTWLNFDAINYRAEVWLNGRRIADRGTMAGMFQRFRFDVTGQVRPGKNVLAVKVFPVDNPGTPDTQLEVLGRDRGYVGKAIMHDVTEIMTIGYDCMMTVPDRNMGLWQPVWIDWTGPVDVRHPFVVTDLPLPETDRATLTISAELTNATDSRAGGVLRGTVAGTDVRFAQPVELAPRETRVVTIDPPPVIQQPRLWWPVNYGGQHLYDLDLQFETVAGEKRPVVSDRERVAFGVREVGYEMHEINGWHGRRVLINGRKIFCRGGYIQPELLFDWGAGRMETEIRYYAEANLNLIYFEDIPNPPEPFLELCDRYGILFGNVFYSCYWLRPGSPYPAEFPLLERCTVDLLKRYRNHPSLVLYMAMNEADTKEDVYTMWRRHVLALDGTRWFIPSAHFPSDRTDVGEWFRQDLPAGMTDKGASYSWAEPEQYFHRVREARNWMFMMESGSASLPPVSSLRRFLPDLDREPAEGDRRYPLDAAWAHHGANHYFRGYDDALRRLHGEPRSVAEYCWKGHLVTADQHRSIYEAANHRMWDITSGLTQWKINACEPSIQWQVFDWYLKPMVSWYYIKKACEPLHVQLNLPDRTVAVINARLAPQPDLSVRARVFDLHGRMLWEKSEPASVEANHFRDCFAVAEPADATPVYFVKLELRDRPGKLLSDNFYWLRRKGTGDYRALQTLPSVALKTTCTFEPRGGRRAARVTVSNPTDRVALFVQLALTGANLGNEILPVLWDDNYFSLLPGESRTLEAVFAADDTAGAGARLEVGGWNVVTPYRCLALKAPKTARADTSFTVTAEIADTFLDGSRVELTVDGRTVDAQHHVARGDETAKATFRLELPRGVHTARVGQQDARIHVP